MWFHRKKVAREGDNAPTLTWFTKRKIFPADAACGLRHHALSVAPADLGVAPGPGHGQVWAVIMEIGLPEVVATLVALAGGTTSLYLSSGRGVVEADAHQRVREAAQRFIALADDHVGNFAPADKDCVPEVGRVRFYARTFDGLTTAEAGARDLAEQRHSLSPLFSAGHEVIAAIRDTGNFEDR